VLYGSYGAIVSLLAGFIILQIPATQESLTNRYLKQLGKITGFEVSFESTYLLWYDHLEVKGLLIKDLEQNTMIKVKDLRVNFRITSLWSQHNVNIDAVVLNNAEVNLIKINESDTSRDLNINIFIDRLSPKSGAGGTPPKVNIGEVIVNRSQFSYDDSDRDSIKNGFDYYHFKVGLEDGEVQNFQVIGDTIQFKVNSFKALDPVTKLDVKSLRTYFRISQNSLEFIDLDLKAGQSTISDTIIFTFNRQRDLSDFNNKVSINARLRNTVLVPEDLALFAPGVEVLAHPVQLTGHLTGRVSRLYLRNMDLQYGNTKILGKMSFDGLPIFNETFMTFQLNRSRMDVSDFQNFLTENVYRRIRPLKKFDLEGTFTGFVNDFVAKADLKGPIGTIRSDINLKVNENNIDQSTYRGNLELTNFDLGTFLGDTTNFQEVNLKGNINGKGLSYSSADFILSGQIFNVGIRGYQYQNIKTNARLARQFFSGKLDIDDPNLKFRATGSIDFREGRDLVNIQAQLDTAQLQPIGLSREHLFIQTYLDINSHGFKIDSLFGDALFKQTKLEFRDQSIQLDSVHLISEEIDKERVLTLRSSLVNATVTGDYYYSTLFHDLTKLAKELVISIKNDPDELKAYYTNKSKSEQSYNAQFMVQLNDLNPLTELAGLDLQFSRGTIINGRFFNSATTILHANTHVDTITYQGKVLEQTDIELTGSKVRDSANVLAVLNVQSARQHINKLNTQRLNIEGLWNRDHIDLSVGLEQVGLSNSIQLRSEIDFLEDSTKIKILPSRIQALEEIWTINQKNYLLLKGSEVSVHALQAQHNEESILLDGEISRSSDKKLKLTIENLGLDILNTLSTEKFGGTLNGTVEGRSLLNEPYLQNNLSIDSLTIDEFLIGDVTGTNEWNQEDKKFDINFAIDRLNERTVDLTGFYDPTDKKSPLNLEAEFNKTNLKILEPVLRGLFSQVGGELTGAYQIRGTFGDPAIQGSGEVASGQILIDYLNTLYTFTGTFEMAPHQFIFRDFIISDLFGNRGNLNGFIAHKNFGKFRLNLDGTFTNFQVLNTTSKDNNLFYGQAYATGNINFFGPASNLKISATGKTEKNSKLYIPINGSSETEKKEFISFTHFTDSIMSKAPVEVKKQTELTGITMDLNLDITPDAYAEIIFDIKAGDIIRGRGNGDIKLQLDTKGEFNMFGLIEFTEGAYNFTLYDIVNKEFTIKPGSRITWYGDPYQGNLNITASYRQLSSLSPIYTDKDIAAAPGIRRKYPLEVLLSLEGQMLSPQINFDLRGVDLPNSVAIEGRSTPARPNFDFNAFKAKLDEQELKRQVFSLIVLKRLSPPDAFATGGTLANSVSEFLSNQLSYWLTQVDQNLEVDFDLDLGTLDQEAFNTFQLRLSYSFLNGRLRVTRDGTFASQNQVQQSAASLAGDWTVDYLLTPDGKFKVKMYSRSNFNTVNASLGAQSAVTTGFSLMHTQNFNELKDLLRTARDRRRKELNGQPPPEDTDGTN
jgi:hypothetical protein